MSVVVAAAFVDRVIVTADCRLTRRHADGREEHWDNLVKLVPCGPWTVLGFVGDVGVAAKVVRGLLWHLRQHGRFGYQARARGPESWRHPSRLHMWLPRFLRWAYARCGGTSQPLHVIVASALPGVPTVISRACAAGVLRDVVGRRSGNGSGTIAGWVMKVLLRAQETGAKWVALSDTYAPRILVMKSPHFRPEYGGPLSFAAIGSGAPVILKGIRERAADLFGAEPAFTGIRLEIAISAECARAGISTVGGLRPTYEISSRGLIPMPQSSQKRAGDPDEEVIELNYAGHARWVQRNVTTGKEVEIVEPWRALADTLAGGKVFGSDFFDW